MKVFGIKINFPIILAILLVFFISTSTSCGCLKCSMKEGLSLIENKELITNIKMDNYEKIQSSHETNTSNVKMNSQTDDLFFFSKNEFSKDCCKNNQSNYSNKLGCVCATSEQADFLSSRGGNSSGKNKC
jgi:hypothetical protein